MKLSTVLGFFTLCFTLALPFASATMSRKRHNEVAHRARGDVDVHKRSFTNARFTYYDVGLGACGVWNNPSDHIVALNVEQFGPGYPGEYCFKTITILYNGISLPATITDKCMGCPWGGLDFSRGLFDKFANEAVGVLNGEWWFNDDN
ncbi:RlpA-like double-psi beta-barrel-protein domain-containing protein-containing protein [Chiua virens]|nr:RlpA-like double-psi beta-barrel-protein domain-containing protein-containing protein [Chiua virens]